MHQIVLRVGIAIVALVLIWFGVQVGWWWATCAVGLVIGIVLRPIWLALVVALVTGCLGWSLPLALLSLNAPVGQIAAAVEGVTGVASTGGVVIILVTILLGGILSLVGAWVGIAGKGLLPA